MVRPDFHRYFDQCQTEGAIAVNDDTHQQLTVSDTTSVNNRNLPASTFEIINLLILLETRTIPDEHYVVKWTGFTDTLKYGYCPNIYQEITVKHAFELSAGWAFIELAKKVDRKYIKLPPSLRLWKCRCVDQRTGFLEFRFFRYFCNGSGTTTQNLFHEKLPFSQRNMAIVRRVMITEQNQGLTIRSKTGWTMVGGINTGWLMGYVERTGKVYFLATQLLQNRIYNRTDFSNFRKDITRTVLKNLKIVE